MDMHWIRGIALLLALMVIAPSGCNISDDGLPRTPDEPLPYGTTDDFLTVKIDGEYRPIFLRGINLGVAVPGTRAGEMAATREDYDRWFEMMSEMGFNAIRVYTLHYPRFYEAIDEFNRNNPDNPLYILHGIWLDEVEDKYPDEVDLFNKSDHFVEGINEVVDCVYGNCVIHERMGRAFGEYEVDASKWVMGWIVGREVYAEEVLNTNFMNPEVRSFEGEAFRIENAQPAEVWWTQKLDHLVDYERSRYGVQRPVSISSWPTLDPIDHPVEDPEMSKEDIAVIDPTLIELVDAPAGIFATYHAYPYYPDYIVDEPDYRKYEDEYGPNSYKGYLERLKGHYEDMPLFIGETGVATSWAASRWGYEDMNQGGHPEEDLAKVGPRLMKTTLETGTAGAAWFAWIDEWWKSTWITGPVDYPKKRRAQWYNLACPEQNFGLLTYDVPEPKFHSFQAVHPEGPVRHVEAGASAAFFHVRVHLGRPLSDDDTLVIGFDTYRADLGDSIPPTFGLESTEEHRGESILPDGEEAEDNRHEFALVIEPEDRSDLYVTLAYDLFGRRAFTSDEEQLYRSIATEGEAWRLVRWQNNRERGPSLDDIWYDATFHDKGHLRMRRADDAANSHDAVVLHDDHIDIRIPWTYLNVVDPSNHRVVHDDRETHYAGFDDYRLAETTVTEGIALTLSLNEEILTETDRFRWEGWDEAPETTERVKAGVPEFSDTLWELPYWMD